MKFRAVACAMIALFPTVFAVAIGLRPPLSQTDVPSYNLSAAYETHHLFDEKLFQARAVWANEAYSGVTGWPQSNEMTMEGKGLNLIMYCYANDEARTLIGPNVDVAIWEWYRQLGGPQHEGPSKEAGHRLYFAQIQMNCYKDDYKNAGDTGTWNLPAGYDWVLAIHKSNRYISRMGFLPGNRATPQNQPGRHFMELKPIELPGATATSHHLRYYLHELGHVIGLAHEHQHPDAPIKLRCENLSGYEQSIDFCLQKFGVRQPGGPPQPFEKWVYDPEGRRKMGEYLCTEKEENLAYALMCGSMFPAYCKNLPSDKAVAPYDWQSIMHYPTMVMVNGQKAYYTSDGSMQWDPSKADITHLANGEERPFPINYGISKGDVEAVKKAYPY